MSLHYTFQTDVIKFLKLSICFLVAHQFHHPYLLRRINVWRVFSCRHLRDGLCHHLLHCLHDGARQTVPGGQLALERKYEFTHTCITVHPQHCGGEYFTIKCHSYYLCLPLQDLFRAVIGAALYLITSLICVIGGAGDGARIAGGVRHPTLSIKTYHSFIFMNKSDLLELHIHHSAGSCL